MFHFLVSNDVLYLAVLSLHILVAYINPVVIVHDPHIPRMNATAAVQMEIYVGHRVYQFH